MRVSVRVVVRGACVCVRFTNLCALQTRSNFDEMSKQTESLMKKMMEVRQMVSVCRACVPRVPRVCAACVCNVCVCLCAEQGGGGGGRGGGGRRVARRVPVPHGEE